MLREILQVQREPENIVDKFAVWVGKGDRGDTSKFAKRIFYFIKSDVYSQCYVDINGKRCNLGALYMIPFGRDGCFAEICICRANTNANYNRLHGQDKDILPSRDI